MASFNQAVTTGSIPYAAQNFNSTDGSWASIRSGSGSGYATAPTTRLVATSTTNQYTILQRGMLGFELDRYVEFPYNIFKVSAASITIGMVSTINGSLWSTSSAEGAGLVLVDETQKTASERENEDFDAITQGGFTECAQRMPYTSFSAGSYYTFNLNSAGLDYLNNLRQTATGARKDEAYFGLCLGADIDNTTPSWVSNDVHEIVFDSHLGTYPPTLWLTYDSPIKIRIGTSWKPCYWAYIKIGTSWRPIEAHKIKVSTWKEK